MPDVHRDKNGGYFLVQALNHTWVGFSRRFLRGNLGYAPRFDVSRSIEELGLSYHPVVETIVDMEEGLR